MEGERYRDRNERRRAPATDRHRRQDVRVIFYFAFFFFTTVYKIFPLTLGWDETIKTRSFCIIHFFLRRIFDFCIFIRRLCGYLQTNYTFNGKAKNSRKVIIITHCCFMINRGPDLVRRWIIKKKKLNLSWFKNKLQYCGKIAIKTTNAQVELWLIVYLVVVSLEVFRVRHLLYCMGITSRFILLWTALYV